VSGYKAIVLVGTSKNLLCDPIAVLRGARNPRVLPCTLRFLRSVRLALKSLATVFRGALVFFVLFFSPTFSDAFDTAPRMTDREIVERLTRLEEGQRKLEAGQQAILRELDKRFEAMDKRFEAIDVQFTRMTQMFVALFLGTIGFALWDRRTMIRPFETKVKTMDEEIGKVKGQQEGVMEAFRLLGRRDAQVAEVLKRFNLL